MLEQIWREFEVARRIKNCEQFEDLFIEDCSCEKCKGTEKVTLTLGFRELSNLLEWAKAAQYYNGRFEENEDLALEDLLHYKIEEWKKKNGQWKEETIIC
jgi:hypothetical protein